MVNTGKLKNHVIETKSVTMSASEQAQNEVTIPAYGDIYGLVINITQNTTGTLTGAKTIEKAIKGVSLKTKSGELVLQSIRGQDLLFLERYLNKGISRTIPTASGTDASETFFIPINVEKADQEAKFQMVVAPYSDMATSGATAGSLAYSVNVLYYDQTENVSTQKIQRTTKAVVSGTNTFGIDLPKRVTINYLLFKVTTEGNLTSIRFTADGKKELDGVTVAYLKALDQASLVSGHISGEFSLYNAPFYCDVPTAFDVVASSTDTMEIFTVGLLNQ